MHFYSIYVNISIDNVSISSFFHLRNRENIILKIFNVRFNHTPDTSWLFWWGCDIAYHKTNHFVNYLHLYFTILWTWLLVQRVYSFKSKGSLGLHSNKEVRFLQTPLKERKKRKYFAVSELWNMGLSLAARRVPCYHSSCWLFTTEAGASGRQRKMLI